jgi:hypothetical protein
MHRIPIEMTELRDVLLDVTALRIKALSLFDWIEDTVVRRSVSATTCSPLPAMGIGCDIEVDQMLGEESLTMLPLDVQILDQERGNDHTRAIMHPSGRDQLPHRGIDEGISGLSFAPSSELLTWLVIAHLGELGVVILTRGMRVVMEDVGIELTPCDLLTEDSPQRRCGLSREVPSMPGVFRLSL